MTPTLTLYAVLALLALGSELDARQLRAPRPAAISPVAIGEAMCLLVALGNYLVWPAPPDLERLVGGSALLVTGVAVRWTAVRTLGGWFLAAEPDLDQPLVTQGLYGLMRHPAAAASVMVAVGGGLVLSAPVGVAMAVLVQIPIVVWATRREDMLLRARFQQDFEKYRERVPGLVPRPRTL